MKQILLFIFAGILAISTEAQKVYFIYLQSDTGTPFYIRMNNKVHSSSSAGYLIVPNLVDSTYNLSLGFAGEKNPDTKFSVTVNNSDRGFLIKQFDEGLGLFDLQSLTVYKPTSTSNAVASEPVAKKTDQFSQLLSKAADDTTILNKPVAIKKEPIKEEKAKEEVQPVLETVKEDKGVVITEEPKMEVKKEETKQEEPKKTEETKSPVSEPVVPQVPMNTKNEEAEIRKDTIAATQPVRNNLEVTQALQPEYRRSVVTRRSESSTTEGFGLVFLDNNNGVVDTIRILIPNSKNPVRSEPPFIEKQNTSNVVTQPANTPPPIVKSKKSCTASASENDFRRLRKNMAGEDNDQDMIEEAEKAFRTRCFTTDQLRNLSALFLTSESKYKFFDAAYTHVSDVQNFSSLQSELKEDYYVKRFKALIGE